MRSLNDVLWNKDGKIGEEKEKYNECQPMDLGEPTLLTDNCACAHGGTSGPPWTPYSGTQRCPAG